MPDTINFEELVPRLEKREQFETIKKAYLYAYNEHKGMKKLREGDFHIGNGYYMNDYIMGLELWCACKENANIRNAPLHILLS